MIRKYAFGTGTPVPTDAVVLSLPESEGEVPFFSVSREGDSVVFRRAMEPADVLFGLGESVRGINKRGFRYVSWNSDIFSHTESTESLYASHNFLVFFGPGCLFGVYLDDPGRVSWDLGFTRSDTAVITSENGNLDLYVLEEDSLPALARSFRKLTGRSYLPPRWAFGYIQSRWGYASEAECRAVAEEHRKRDIPLDGICMDIDYMEEYKNFTWRKDAFPDLERFSRDMREEHIHLVPIIDAGIRQEEGYPPYDSGKAGDSFCKKGDGSDFTAAVWPGLCCFPDFLREDVRRWFGSLYRPLLEAGVEGFWNDMNEPSLFYTPERLEAALLRTRETASGGDYEALWSLSSAFNSLANNEEDYRSFFHHPSGTAVRHDKVHNLYGAFMTRASAEGFRRFDPDRRFLLFSRSSFIGAHRNGGVWTGDNSSWWSHLKLVLQMLPNLNLCGFLYSGCDLGGFSCNVTEDLLARFLQLGVFTPLMRNHSALHTREQEVYRFSSWEDLRSILRVRYALLPFLYSEFMKAALSDGMYFRPLAFDYPEDPRAVATEDQLLLGEGCMIAPVLEQNASGRYVYLPEDMLMIRFRSPEDYDLVPLDRGDHRISLGLREFPLFVKKNHAVLLCPGGTSTETLDDRSFTVLGRTDTAVRYDLYRDDGIDPHPVLEEHLTPVFLPAAAPSGPIPGVAISTAVL